MNEIEKMFENAGIEPTITDACTVEDKYWQNEKLANIYGTFDMYMNAKCGQQEDCTTLCSYAYTKEEYPTFTAEKQLELIKWLLEKWMDVRFVHNLDGIYYISSFNNASYIGKNLEECIASFVNNAWQDLTEEDKINIKNILEM